MRGNNICDQTSIHKEKLINKTMTIKNYDAKTTTIMAILTTATTTTATTTTTTTPTAYNNNGNDNKDSKHIENRMTTKIMTMTITKIIQHCCVAG